MNVNGSSLSNAVQKALQHASGRGGGKHLDDAAGKHERRALPDHQREYVAVAGAQRHADPDLPPALRHRVAEQAIDAQRDEEQGEPRERYDEDRAEARLRDRVRQPCLHCHHRAERRLRVRYRCGFAEKRNHCQRVAGRPDGEAYVHLDIPFRSQ